MRMPRRPREATTRSMPTTRSMLCVPERAPLAGGSGDAGEAVFGAARRLVSTMRK
jgi:hypothetical protein